jgi:hypothetical protein
MWFLYKGKSVDLRQIGREFNVRYVLEGSVQRVGARMRVNVQLIEAESGAHLWAERFDKPIADLFEMQDEIVSRIANQLGHELARVEAGWAERSAKPDSMDHYSLGPSKGQGRQPAAQKPDVSLLASALWAFAVEGTGVWLQPR